MTSRRPTTRIAALVAVVFVVLAGLTVGVAVAQPTAVAAPASSTLFVVDTSGSMDGSRLDQARSALRSSIGALGAGQAAGLRRYGGDCGDPGTLEVPLATDNRDRLRTAVDGLRAGGGTPTTDALRAAAADLPSGTAGRQIVLISDGASSCGDPCPVAAELSRQLGVGFTVHTVGYQAPDAAEGELACVARETGGRYFTADRPDELAAAITTVVSNPTPPKKPCETTRFIAAAGSGQYYKGEQDLSISPQLTKAYDGFTSRLAPGTTVRKQVLSYPAESTEVLTRDLGFRWGSIEQAFGENLPLYLGGKDTGVSALRGAVTQALEDCPGQRIVLAGYSQGALVIHEYLAKLAASGDRTTASAIRAVILLADPARVSGSRVLEMGTAFDVRSHGICQVAKQKVNLNCVKDAGLADVPAPFRSVAVSVCLAGDPVCDTSTFIATFGKQGVVTTEAGRKVLLSTAMSTHTTFLERLPHARNAGQWAARTAGRN